ncbi:MAG: tetratricopeptide repeat protein [Deltaproteobacteria bacterium]|nr:tetratricopeptide repeat protein [Deltaproteobacteria bacterium]
MKEPFKIVQVTANARLNEGDYIYRIHQPGAAMGRIPGVVVVNTSILSPHLEILCRCADLLILHLTWEPDLLPIVDERKKRGLATVYEISDNFTALPPSVNFELSFSNPVCLGTVFQLIRMADAAQGVSQVLLDRFSFLNPRRVVFENQIALPGPPPGPPGGEITIGWGGSLGHTEDLKAVAPVIRDVLRSYPFVRFSFMGNRRQFEEVFGSHDDPRLLYRQGGSLEDYFRFLDELDVGIAPLAPTAFNLCRSDVKFIEYGSRGVVPVLSRVGPYLKNAREGQTALFFEDASTLHTVLDRLLRTPSLIFQLARNAHRYVMQNRLEDDHAAQRVRFYQSLCRVRSEEELPFDALEQVPGTRLYYSRVSEAEAKTVQGIDLWNHGEKAEALALWKEACRLMPAYYHPALLRAYAGDKDGTDRLSDLQRAHPKSLRLRMLQGQALRDEDPERAAKAFEEALAIFSDFAPAWVEIAGLEKRKGDAEGAARILDRALERNPFDAAAAHALGGIYASQGKTDLAAQAFRVALDLIPDNHTYRLDLIQALTEEGALGEAIEVCRDHLEKHPGDRQVAEILSAILRFCGQEEAAREVLRFAGF